MEDERLVASLEVRARSAFRAAFGTDPLLVASAPGRINLIGEHTDYNEGFVLPIAIDRYVAAAVGWGNDEAFSADFQEKSSLATSSTSWAAYPAGVLAVFRDSLQSPSEPLNIAFAGDVPIGVGLSSSAAIECATAVSLSHLAGLAIGRPELARMCQRAENDHVGVQSGIMDQFASLLGKRDQALFVDCRSLDYRLVPFRPQEHGLTLVACSTGSERRLASSGYNERSAACERAAAQLGLNSLREASTSDLARLTGEELKRARHVISENARVLRAVEALEGNDYEVFGALMYESHASLRNDYEVSTAPLDVFVELARKAGAIGARLTGAGFGGCAIALVPSGAVGGVTESVNRGFANAGFTEPTFYRFTASDGADMQSVG